MTDIVCFWAADARTWIMYAVDGEGNQLWDAQYFPNRRVMEQALAF